MLKNSSNYLFTTYILAALQLFGALMPRILGQKKLRENDDTPGDSLALHNSVTAQELFTRHPGLAPYLLQNLKQLNETGINPSLVPILSMLSR